MGFANLVTEITACRLCASTFEHEPRPVIQASSSAKILIAGQAPGLKVQISGVPFDDASGDRLRAWMGVDKTTFYDPNQIAIVPMAFCYPGKAKSGDLAPPAVCANTWRNKVLANLTNIQLTLLVGQYAQQWHAKHSLMTNHGAVSQSIAASAKTQSLTERVHGNNWQDNIIALPHPSPRNNIWLKKNSWFESEQVHKLSSSVAAALSIVL